VLFALGTGVARGAPGAAVLKTLGLLVHTLLLALSAAIGFAILPLRTALVPPGSGVRAREHNCWVVLGWVIALAAACLAAGLESRTWLEGLTAAVAVGSVGLVRLGALAPLAIRRGWNLTAEPRQPIAAAGSSVGQVRLAAWFPRGWRFGARLLTAFRLGWALVPEKHRPDYIRTTTARSALITIAFLFWFALVPVPARVSFQVIKYEMILAPGQLGRFLGVTVAAVGLVLAAGWLSLTLGWARLDQEYRRLHAQFRFRLQAGQVKPAIAAAIEAALEGYRVAADTQSPVLASDHLKTIARALEHETTPEAFYRAQPAH
jgi:hypothetical protein